MTGSFYDVIILGAGPAGLQAAIHAARRKVSVLVIGQPSKSSVYKAHIENFCCTASQSGAEMLDLGRAKAGESGAEFLEQDVMSIGADDDKHYLVETAGGETLKAHSLILAMGISRNKLGLSGEKELVGRGVSYCVDCDGPFFKNEPVAVVGSGSAAAGAALTMLFYASKVHLVCDALDVDAYLSEKLHESEVQLHEGRKVTRILGDDAVSGLEMDDGTKVDVAGVFIELGAKGAVDFAGRLGILLDETMKYIAVNRKQETNLPGIYAAGDICGPPWQVAKSVGEGCVAGIEAASYAAARKRSGRDIG